MINILPDLKICQEAQGIVKESKFWWREDELKKNTDCYC
jgi:hypothetical protein